MSLSICDRYYDKKREFFYGVAQGVSLARKANFKEDVLDNVVAIFEGEVNKCDYEKARAQGTAAALHFANEVDNIDEATLSDLCNLLWFEHNQSEDGEFDASAIERYDTGKHLKILRKCFRPEEVALEQEQEKKEGDGANNDQDNRN